MAEGAKFQIYAVKTTTGQERIVASLASSRVALKKLQVASILVLEEVKGYIFVEAPGPHHVDDALAGVKHARGRTKGNVSAEYLEKFLATKPVITEVEVGAIVEVIAGPFKGLRAKVIGVDQVKEEVTIQLLEEGFATMPVTVYADYVKIIERPKGD